jgi:hypothetical protein
MPDRRHDWTKSIDFPSHEIDFLPSRNLFLGNLHPPINAACLSSDQKEERRLLGNTGTTRETHALHKAPSDMLSMSLTTRSPRVYPCTFPSLTPQADKTPCGPVYLHSLLQSLVCTGYIPLPPESLSSIITPATIISSRYSAVVSTPPSQGPSID